MECKIMARRRLFGSVTYYVRRTATHCRTGEETKYRFGSFRTHRDADQKVLEDEEAVRDP
jgi:hypothetical protein